MYSIFPHKNNTSVDRLCYWTYPFWNTWSLLAWVFFFSLARKYQNEYLSNVRRESELGLTWQPHHYRHEPMGLHCLCYIVCNWCDSLPTAVTFKGQARIRHSQEKMWVIKPPRSPEISFYNCRQNTWEVRCISTFYWIVSNLYIPLIA